MDDEERLLVAQSHDPVIAARIISNIENVERDWHLASGLLSERLMRDVRELFGKLTPENWKMFLSGWSALIVPPDWKMTRGVGNGDAWLELAEFCDAEEEEYSWIAAAVGIGSTKMGLELQFRNGLIPFGEALIADDIPTFHSTRTGLEDMFGEFRDMPFPVDEANLADSSDKQFVKDFAFRFANGVPKISRNQTDRAQYRFVFAITANEPFREALGKMNGDTSGAALQRLMPLRIDPDRSEGVFSYVPEGFTNPGAFATYLNDTIELQYGTPMQAFLQALVAKREANPEKFIAKIRQRIAAFETRAGVASATRGKTRATTAFGLLYAAGSIAKAKAILPEAWDCMAACLAAYRNYQACLPDQTPLQTRLLTIAQRTRTLDLRDGSTPKLSDERMASHGAFIKLGKSKRVELLLTEGIKREFFSDWSQLKSTKDFKDMNLSGKDHDGQQRQVRLGKKKERFICFILPPELVGQLDASAEG